MPTFKFTIAYDGTHFAGWQVQASGRTVQATLEEAIAKITGCRTRAVASGRTDAGVHALGQVVSVELETHLTAGVLQRALNANLPEDVVIRRIETAPPGFHAIRDALSKRYRYRLDDGPVADPFERHYCWKVWQRLDVPAMQRAADFLIGRHDFRSFQSSGSERKTTVRTVTDLSIQRGAGRQASLITLEIQADGFLYNMVRAIVGSLVEVGRGAKSETWLAEVLAARDRRQAAMTAPPQGLFLVEVEYGGDEG